MEKTTSISVNVKDVLSNLKWDHKSGTVDSSEIVKSVVKSPSYVKLVHAFNLLNIKHKKISLEKLLSNSLIETIKLKSEDMQIEHLLLGMLKTLGSKKYKKFKLHVQTIKSSHSTSFSSTKDKFDGLVQDLTAIYRDKQLKDVVSRRELENDLITRLCSKYKSSILLIGPKGSGKTSAIISLANRIKNNDVPTMLQGSRIISVNLNKIMSKSSSVSYSTFDIVNLVANYSQNNVGYTIFFFDDIHLLNTFGLISFTPPMVDEFFNLISEDSSSNFLKVVGKALKEDKQSASSIDRVANLSFNNKVVFIASLNEYYSDRFLESPLQELWSMVYIKNPTNTELKKILRSKIPQLEAHYKVLIDTKVVPLVCNSISYREVNEGNVVGQAIKILDSLVSNYVSNHYISHKNRQSHRKSYSNTSSNGHSRRKLKVTRSFATNFLSKHYDTSLTQQPVSYNVKSLNTIKRKMSHEIVGQDAALNSLTSIIKRSYLGIKDPKKPMCSLLFLGPTGVGKSQTAKSLATNLYSDKQLLRIDMADFAEKHTVAKLVGSPPGYVGYGEGGQLTDFIKQYPRSVVLFDEIEKAHSDVLNILLSILQEGEITSGDGEIVRFNESIVILTSNLGAEILSRNQIGFNNDTFDVKNKKAEEALMLNLKKKIKPEILNRLDDIVVFNSLKKSHAKTIIDKNLHYYNNLLNKKHKTTLKYDKDIINYLLDKGYSVEYGARELNRSIEKNLLTPVVDTIIKHYPKVKPEYKVSIKRGELVVG